MNVVHILPIYRGTILILQKDEELTPNEILKQLYEYAHMFYFDINKEKFNVHFQIHQPLEVYSQEYINKFYPFNNNLNEYIEYVNNTNPMWYEKFNVHQH